MLLVWHSCACRSHTHARAHTRARTYAPACGRGLDRACRHKRIQTPRAHTAQSSAAQHAHGRRTPTDARTRARPDSRAHTNISTRPLAHASTRPPAHPPTYSSHRLASSTCSWVRRHGGLGAGTPCRRRRTAAAADTPPSRQKSARRCQSASTRAERVERDRVTSNVSAPSSRDKRNGERYCKPAGIERGGLSSKARGGRGCEELFPGLREELP